MNSQIASHLSLNKTFERKYKLVIAKFLLLLTPKKIKGIYVGLSKLVAKLEELIPADFAQWNTNGINEMAKRDDIELHIVAPLYWIPKEGIIYTEKDIHYHFFYNQLGEISFLFIKAFNSIFKKKECEYKKNRIRIKAIVNDIKPDVVHVIGAENPQYSLSALDFTREYPVIVQLQTLLCDPDMIKMYPEYTLIRDTEKQILQRVDYIGTPIQKYIDIIREQINSHAAVIKTTLAVGEEIDRTLQEKEFDFVYFSANLSKAGDLAIDAFGRACKKHPGLTLKMIGGFDDSFKEHLDKLIEYYGIQEAVHFMGLLPTHENVLQEVRKARFALLPLKSDITSGTIREAFSLGLPVITTITTGTPDLNSDMECVLLSEIGDSDRLADNIICLVENEKLQDRLRENGFRYMERRYSNAKSMEKWMQAYYACVNNFRDGTPIPNDLLT